MYQENLFMKNKKHSTILASLLLLSSGVFAQTLETPPQTINPFNRQFITQDSLNALANSNAPSTQTADASAERNKITTADQQKLLQQIDASKSKNALPKESESALLIKKDNNDVSTITEPTKSAPLEKAFQRYIPDTDSNNGSIDYYESKATKQNNYYINKYSNRAPQNPAASNNPKDMVALSPYIESLRQMGVSEGKISVELNRLTTPQFIHWAMIIAR